MDTAPNVSGLAEGVTSSPSMDGVFRTKPLQAVTQAVTKQLQAMPPRKTTLGTALGMPPPPKAAIEAAAASGPSSAPSSSIPTPVALAAPAVVATATVEEPPSPFGGDDTPKDSVDMAAFVSPSPAAKVGAAMVLCARKVSTTGTFLVFAARVTFAWALEVWPGLRARLAAEWTRANQRPDTSAHDDSAISRRA
jgi:hypothetical protein